MINSGDAGTLRKPTPLSRRRRRRGFAALNRCINAVRPDDIFDELHENDGGKEENHDGREAFEYSEDDAETSDDKGEKRGVRAPTHL